MSKQRGFSEETKRMIVLKIKHDNIWALANKLAYSRRQVRNGTMTQEVFTFIEEEIEKRKKEKKL